MGKWDREVDFDATRQKLSRAYVKAKELEAPKWAADLGVLLVQLSNGSRIGEAVAAFREWRETGKRELRVKALKMGDRLRCQGCGAFFSIRVQGKDRGIRGHQTATGHEGYTREPNPETRLMILPPEIADGDRGFLTGELVTVEGVRAFCRRAFDFNTHSLRYSFVSREAEKGTPAQVIAASIHKSDINGILRYTEKRIGEDRLREVVANA